MTTSNMNERYENGKRYWWLNEESQSILNKGYLLRGETTEGAIDRVTTSAAKRLNKPEYAPIFKEIIEKGWMSLSSPIWANMGTQRGLPISCVVGDTWINTPGGGIQAKDIQVGDLVLTHKNRFRRVVDVKATENKRDIYRLKVNSRMTNLYLTGNHPVLTNLGWVRTDELNPDIHLVAVNGGIELPERDYIIDMKDFVDYAFGIDEGLIKKSVESESKIPRANLSPDYVTYYSQVREFVEIDDELSWALGVWFAEGSLSRNAGGKPNGIRITVGSHERESVAERWLDIMSRKFNVHGNMYESVVHRNGKVNSWISVNLNSIVVGKYFESFGEGCKHKEIPSYIMDLPKSKVRHFLNGFILGDGTRIPNGHRVTIANPVLTLGLYNMGLKLGEDMSLQMQEKAGKMSSVSNVYTVIFRSYENKISKKSPSSGIRFNDGLIYCPIKMLELTDRVETVYDFTVEEDHSFSCAGVVVHNCFNVHVPDNIEGIAHKIGEVIMQTKLGGGTSGYFGELRHRGASITDNGTSSGAVSFLEPFNTIMNVVSQGS